MITANVLQRTFQISFGESRGTCFTVDDNNRQYIVTARHLVGAIEKSATIRIKRENVWKDYPVNLVGHCTGKIDISVLAAERQLSPEYHLTANTHGLELAQDVYFLGFPYDWASEVGEINRDFPFIKKALLSAVKSSDPNSKDDILYLDGHNNPGFSGGPVVFSRRQQPADQFSVAGVISGYKSSMEPVYFEKKVSPLEYEHNTGIIVAYSIRHAMDLIHQNPIGFNSRKKETA